MRVLVCGGRNYADADTMARTLDALHAQTPITVLIYGMARGADDLAKMWATARGIKRLGYPAQWEKHGQAAGPIRNREMLEKGKPEFVVAFPGGKGTTNMVNIARKAGVPIHQVTS